ncbi:Prephenate dehydratase-domain-containing protein [Clohesyomyces aquaticus]|uniref:prephenate dehydratase n=1 Tax=Clohesyomyces aquaticus TaxID=1231657 RepID=A0A1Y1YJH9_9PLEO|nr:Prephenate dehydratase-domain-containing protein [Clohesyomyces aquaticus]
MAEDKPSVTYLGPKASYTHQATLDKFSESQYTLTPCITIEDVFCSVQSSSSHRGVVPFENSTNGSVVFTLDLFADLHGKYPDILVCGEAYIKVQHCLLGYQDPNPYSPSSAQREKTPHTSGASSPLGISIHTQNHHPVHVALPLLDSPLSSGAVTPTPLNPLPLKPSARPVGDLRGIRKLYSHPQAWGQCKAFLNTYLKGVERQDVSSTSRAAELVTMDPSGESAAISSGIAAKVFGLKVLARGVEERGDNCTRFFVIRKREERPQPPSTPSSGSLGKAEESNYKSLISFTIPPSSDAPGALAHSLAVFSKYGLNLTSINTRPSGVQNWNYIFFVEIRGRRERDGKGSVNMALEDLGRVCRGWRWLGSWEGGTGMGGG